MSEILSANYHIFEACPDRKRLKSVMKIRKHRTKAPNHISSEFGLLWAKKTKPTPKITSATNIDLFIQILHFNNPIKCGILSSKKWLAAAAGATIMGF